MTVEPADYQEAVQKELIQIRKKANIPGFRPGVIFDALLTIPLGLYLCKKQCKKLSVLENEEEKLLGYKKAATMRILLVSNTMVFAIVAFYLMGAYQSMLWVAAVAAIGWYFTKPSERKMELELQPQDPTQENY